MSDSDHDTLVVLKSEVESIKKRLEGNVPERCARVDSTLDDIRSDISAIQSTLQWIWRTLAAAAISAAAAMIIRH